MDLWFVEYLIVLYLLAAVSVMGIRLVLPQNVGPLLLQLFRSAVQSLWAPLIFAVPSFLVMLLMKHAWLEDPPSLVPASRIVLAYAIPFAFGWLLDVSRDLLETLSRRAWLYTVVAVVMGIAHLALIYSSADHGTPFYAARAAHALAMWCLIFGITGLFLRYLDGYSALRRYLCDSSYFLYIAHIPMIIAFQLLLRDVPLPPLAERPRGLAATIAVLRPPYRYGVRPTFVAAALNGLRYAGALMPTAAAAV